MLTTLVPEAWLTVWRCMRAYHRFEVDGFETLSAPGAALVVGYHARGWAIDLCILTVEVYERLGYLPHAIFHESIGQLPVFRTLLGALGGVTGNDPALDAAVARGEHVMVLPGGGREAFRSVCQRYRVNWGDRLGYLKLALKLDVPIVPVASAGVDELYLGLNDGYRWGKRLGVPFKLPFWVAPGLGGFFPLALPFPVRLSQVIGPRIPLDAAGRVAADDAAALLALHRVVTGELQSVIDRAVAKRRTTRAYCR